MTSMNLTVDPDITLPQIDISVQDPVWETLQDIENTVNETVTAALTHARMPEFTTGRSLEISLVLANDDLVQVLNREYRDKDKPTNVLTFATLDAEEPELDEGDLLNLGDVILAYETLDREAHDQGKFFMDHMKHLIVHGVLHLLGYDHQDEDEATDMETLEIRILEKLNVQNPYTENEFKL